MCTVLATHPHNPQRTAHAQSLSRGRGQRERERVRGKVERKWRREGRAGASLRERRRGEEREARGGAARARRRPRQRRTLSLTQVLFSAHDTSHDDSRHSTTPRTHSDRHRTQVVRSAWIWHLRSDQRVVRGYAQRGAWRGPIVVHPPLVSGTRARYRRLHRKAERALRREDQAARPASAKRVAPRPGATFLAAAHAVDGCVLRARLRSLARGLAWERAAELKPLQALPQRRRRGRRQVRRGE